MSTYSKHSRRALVLRLREEGAAAALAGQSRQTCPHEYMNRYQWLSGYDSVVPPETDTEQGDTMSDTKPVKLELWAVPVEESYRDERVTRWVGVFVPEGEPVPTDAYDAIVASTHESLYGRENRGFYTVAGLADAVQTLLRNLGEGKVGR